MQIHQINGHPLNGPYPPHLECVQFGMGCFWGVERLFWRQQGVYVTAVGYSGGASEEPTYEEVCRGDSGHTEVVLVVFDPDQVRFEELLKLFWCSHDPTQGMRQGNDVGSQYRSAIYFYSEVQRKQIETSKNSYQQALYRAGHGEITTEILSAPLFNFAESYHQQYLAKNPSGYCSLHGLGVEFKAHLVD